MPYFMKALKYLCLCFYFLQSGLGSAFSNSRNHTSCELCVTWLPEEFYMQLSFLLTACWRFPDPYIFFNGKDNELDHLGQY